MTASVRRTLAALIVTGATLAAAVPAHARDAIVRSFDGTSAAGHVQADVIAWMRPLPPSRLQRAHRPALRVARR